MVCVFAKYVNPESAFVLVVSVGWEICVRSFCRFALLASQWETTNTLTEWSATDAG